MRRPTAIGLRLFAVGHVLVVAGGVLYLLLIRG
jgi:hypothetical protein